MLRLKMNNKEENSKIESTVLVCCIVDKSYGIWCSVEKRMRFEESDMELCLGNFYKVETILTENGKKKILKAIKINSPFEVNIVYFPSNRCIVVAKVSVFIGNQCPSTKEYIGYTNFFGQVLLDASFTTLKVEQFKTYLCTIRTISKSSRGCYWKVEQIIRPDNSLKYYLLKSKVELQEDGSVTCLKDNYKLTIRQDYLRQHCFDDLFSLLSIYIIAFKNEPSNSNCLQFNCCYATLIDDFSNELSKNALVPRETSKCCDDYAEERIEILNELVHNAEFLTKCFNNNPELKERLLSLLVGNSKKENSQIQFLLLN